MPARHRSIGEQRAIARYKHGGNLLKAARFRHRPAGNLTAGHKHERVVLPCRSRVQKMLDTFRRKLF
ncbi:hypothetical protein [Nitrosospira sp. Nsp13]|uniref:hypothetical protein n=1 Tax=Nitrosospira sp. Nsp13 TaxID=1855332 RepID=UPI001113211F|nr:hypothetical protein [Nitrosospira sp. Nsp13]